MFLALTVLMFHVSATPRPLALPAAAAAGTATAALAATAASEVIEEAPVPTVMPAPEVGAVEAPVTTEFSLDPESQPAPAVAYTPGVLTPQPVAPVSPVAADPAAIRPISSEEPFAAADNRNVRRLWIGLSIAQHGAATFDAWSTRRVISSGAGQELNPMLRPFAGNASLYIAVQVAPAILDYVGHRMMYSQHGWARRTWWVPQTLGTVMSVVTGVHNMGVYSAY
jgi:hypothetical protein